MIERPRHPGEPTFVFAIPVSTFLAEKTPRRRNRTSGRVSRPSPVIWPAKLTTRGEKRKHARSSPTKCRSGKAASVMYSVAVCALARRKLMAAQ